MTVEATRPRRSVVQARPSKYRAVKQTVDGITFDSKAEARRYSELKLLEKAGEISRLMCQFAFQLCVQIPRNVEDAGGVVIGSCIGEYVADFVYSDGTGEFVVEDVKGFKTPLYRWKKKHVEAQYGITVREIR